MEVIPLEVQLILLITMQSNISTELGRRIPKFKLTQIGQKQRQSSAHFRPRVLKNTQFKMSNVPQLFPQNATGESLC